MSPTSRNTLMIGGALILIALMLVCGPLSDRLGLGGKGVEEAPSVAAGPPVVEVESADAVEAVAAGALVGASNREPDVASLDEVKAEDEPAVVAEVAGAAAGAGVAAEGDSGAGGGGTVLPAVSAGVPTTDVADEAAIAASAV